MVSVEVRFARALAPDGEPSRVVRALERRRTVGAEVDGAARDAASDVVVDAHRQVVAVDEGH